MYHSTLRHIGQQPSPNSFHINTKEYVFLKKMHLCLCEVQIEVILILPKAFQTYVSSKFNPNSSKFKASTIGFLFRYRNRARLLSSGVRQKRDSSATVANRPTILQIYGHIDIHVKAGYAPLLSHRGIVEKYLRFSNISRFIQRFETKWVNGNNITQLFLYKMVYTRENRRKKLFFWLSASRK
jgi:hypothetical protein